MCALPINLLVESAAVCNEKYFTNYVEKVECEEGSADVSHAFRVRTHNKKVKWVLFSDSTSILYAY